MLFIYLFVQGLGPKHLDADLTPRSPRRRYAHAWQGCSVTTRERKKRFVSLKPLPSAHEGATRQARIMNGHLC